MSKEITLSERQGNNLIAVALMANEVVESAREPKGHYVLVSKRKLSALKDALELLKKKRD